MMRDQLRIDPSTATPIVFGQDFPQAAAVLRQDTATVTATAQSRDYRVDL